MDETNYKAVQDATEATYDALGVGNDPADGEQAQLCRKTNTEVSKDEGVTESYLINANGIDSEVMSKDLPDETNSSLVLEKERNTETSSQLVDEVIQDSSPASEKNSHVSTEEGTSSHKEAEKTESEIKNNSENVTDNAISFVDENNEISVNENANDTVKNNSSVNEEGLENINKDNICQKSANDSDEQKSADVSKENIDSDEQSKDIPGEISKDSFNELVPQENVESDSAREQSDVQDSPSEINPIEENELVNTADLESAHTSKDEDPIMETEDYLELNAKEDAAEKSVDHSLSDEESRDCKSDKEAAKDSELSGSGQNEGESICISNEVANADECVQLSEPPHSPGKFESVESTEDHEEIRSSDKDHLLDVDPVGQDVLNCELIEGENENENDNENENESESQKEADELSKGNESVEEMDVDVAAEGETDKKLEKEDEDKPSNVEEVSDGHKETASADEPESLEEPGGSEEETITGDTSTQPPAELTQHIGKDAEVCIIPDDVTPTITTLAKKEQKKEASAKSVEVKEKCVIKVAIPEMEKPRLSSLLKRPTRNAAKVAGSKIKSLVQNDLATEEAGTGPESPRDVEPTKEVEPPTRLCAQCQRIKTCKFQVIQGDTVKHVCTDSCYNLFLKSVQGREVEISDVENGLIRTCAQCRLQITPDDKTLSWETMEFCNDDCLGKYQTELGSHCANCKGSVASTSLGKYCVRFGYDVKQFCTASCLEEYKKGLKVCSYCQKDISSGTEGFLAPVGGKGQFKDFCLQSCMEKYGQMTNNVPPPEVIAECAVCSDSKPVKVEVELGDKTEKLCSEPCFAAFKFVKNITEGHCDMCKKYFDKLNTQNFSIYYEDSPHSFCCKTCMNVYILANRKIVPCNWCKVKKYNFDMIRKKSTSGQVLMMCSLNCLMLYQGSISAISARRIKCDFCLNWTQAQYHLTMSDATIRNFCTYNCVLSFQKQYPKQPMGLSGSESLNLPIPTGNPKRVVPRRSAVVSTEAPCVPVIASVKSLAPANGPVSPSPARVSLPPKEVNIVQPVTPVAPITIQAPVATLPPPPPQVYQQIITKPAPAKEMKNKAIWCKPYTHTKGVSCRPHPCVKETQTDESLNRKCLIPVPVPIFVPAPMMMYSAPFPVVVPFPLPVPVPIFIPTTRNSAKGIFKEIKKIQEKIPTDPFEAELLMMAEMVAGEKKQDPTDSESEDGNEADDGADATFSPENVDTSNTFGEDMLQMALKMASELEEPAVDMESVLTTSTITPSSQPPVDPNKGLYASDPDDPEVPVMSINRGRKRAMRGARNSAGPNQSKRGRRTSSSVDVPMLPPPEPVPPPRIEVEKPDANMCLKYTFGVNAWRHWVMQKNAELEKVALTNRKIKLFKPELLQLTADELNFSLCLFVKEVRKPNGTEYAPDTIYYLCLGIQQYLFENGRIDNIFTDSYYEKFTDCLDEVAKRFAALYNDSQYIVTRVEEEHLWESKQLGAHSPHVLLSTLMFFNTKHFNLVTVEEHMQLSFSHIMKHWKRNPNAPGVAKVPGSRNVLLRFYPPQSALEANSRKKKVYEQQENEENPLRCPVKLYEFYLSKCPESVKTRNDVFYLLPERSCVPDSPVWYSTMALGKEPLMKMLHRVKMVKEINIALLTC